MERRGNQYVIIDLLDFNVCDLCDARIPGLIVPGTSDLADRGNYFPDRAA